MNFAVTLLLSPLLLLGSTSIQSSLCDPLSNPTIQSPVDAEQFENGAVFVEGTADEGSTVVVQRDGQTAASTTADTNDSFGVTVVVPDGSHTIKAIASNPCENKASQEVTIFVKSAPVTPGEPGSPPESPKPTPQPSPSPIDGEYYDPGQPAKESSVDKNDSDKGNSPRLDIAPGIDNQTTYEVSAYISGTFSSDGTVTILRGETVIATLIVKDGIFGARIPLEIGKNELTIRGETSDGVSVEKKISITRVSNAVGSGRQNMTSEIAQWFRSPVVYITAGVIALVALGTVILSIFSGGISTGFRGKK